MALHLESSVIFWYKKSLFLIRCKSYERQVDADSCTKYIKMLKWQYSFGETVAGFSWNILLPYKTTDRTENGKSYCLHLIPAFSI